MNNYCRNCGKKIDGQNFCESCGTKVLTNRVGELDKILAKKYIKIFFAIIAFYVLCVLLEQNTPYLIRSYLAKLFLPVFYLLPLALIIFTIYAKRKLRYSKFFNITFWIMLLLIILFILLIIFMLISCEYKF